MVGGKGRKLEGLIAAAALEVVVEASSSPEKKRIKTVEVGESLDLFDGGSSKPLSDEEKVQNAFKRLSIHRSCCLFAVFGLKFKYAEEHRSRDLRCIVTIDDVQKGGSQDIYNGFLPKPKKDDDGFIELVLTGPNSYTDGHDGIYILVAIYDPDDPDWIGPPAPHNCGGLCQREIDIPCGSYELMRNSSIDELLIWTWIPGLHGYGTVFTHDIVYKGPPLVPGLLLPLRDEEEQLDDEDQLDDEEQLDNPAGSTISLMTRNPGSLILRCGAFEGAMFANEVKVEVKESRHSCVVMVKAVIVKKDGLFTDQEILLFQNDQNVEIFGTRASCYKNIKSKGRPHEPLIPLELSRSSVTLPSLPSLLIVKVLLGDPFTKEVVEYNVDFPSRRSPVARVIEGDVVRGKNIAVTVFWEDFE